MAAAGGSARPSPRPMPVRDPPPPPTITGAEIFTWISFAGALALEGFMAWRIGHPSLALILAVLVTLGGMGIAGYFAATGVLRTPEWIPERRPEPNLGDDEGLSSYLAKVQGDATRLGQPSDGPAAGGVGP